MSHLASLDHNGQHSPISWVSTSEIVAEVQLTALAKGLDRARPRATVFCFYPDRGRNEELSASGIPKIIV